MRYETLVARFLLRLVEFPRALAAISHVIKDKGSGVKNEKIVNLTIESIPLLPTCSWDHHIHSLARTWICNHDYKVCTLFKVWTSREFGKKTVGEKRITTPNPLPWPPPFAAHQQNTQANKYNFLSKT